MEKLTKDISLEEVSLFMLINIIIIFFGIILWYYIWIKDFGIMIPNPQFSDEPNLTFFNSKNFSIATSELWKRIKEFDKHYLIRSVGHESYIYLVFQRKLIYLIFTMAIFSFFFSFISVFFMNQENHSFLQDFLLNNKYLNDFTTIVHIVSVILFTFLHFRFFTVIKTEAKHLYFDRFDKMSRKKDSDWLSCRTLHISGLGPNERNTSFLKRKLDLFLCEEDGGKVIDVKFIPDYKTLLELERERNEIVDIRDLISTKENTLSRRVFFPRVFRTEKSIQDELENVENKIQEATENPVYSSGHAFVCFDSLLSAYKCLNAFQDGTIKKLNLRLKFLWQDFNKKFNNKKIKSSFRHFDEEDLEVAMMDPDKVNLLVDQMVEPFDIIWTNVGGDRGIYIFRRIICNIVLILVLIFLSTPTTLFSTLKSMDYFSLLEFTWIIKVPYGYIIKTYLPPMIILILNILLIFLIDLLSIFERHFTHSRFQYSVFTKSFFYMMLNLLIIPGVTLTAAESLFSIIYQKIYNIPELLSKIYISNSGYFFVTLLIQNGTISSMFYLLRLDELGANSLSPFVAFYKRYFINSNKQWHRTETDAFQFGYYYAQILTFYTIALVFSTTVPSICPATFYFFFIRHIVDYISLLSVHRIEMDSSGNLINSILNFSCIPVLLYHVCMMSFFLVKGKYTAAIITLGIFFLSIIYICFYNSKYILDTLALHEKLKVYEPTEDAIPSNEVNKWRNKFRHPLVIPIGIFTCESESESQGAEETKNISNDMGIEQINIGPLNNSNNLNDSYLENSINSESNLRIIKNVEIEMKNLAEEN